LYFSPHIIGMVISRRMSWVGHMTLTRERRKVYVGNRKRIRRRSRWEFNTKIGLEIRRSGGWGEFPLWLTWLRAGNSDRLLSTGNEPSNFFKMWGISSLSNVQCIFLLFSYRALLNV
jgi:hypothetical protein